MKKLSLLGVCLLFLLTACLDDPLRNKMIDYYSNDENYVTVSGEILSIDEDRKCVTISVQAENDKACWESEGDEFMCYDFSLLELIEVGDYVTFTTSAMIFYSGQIYPIVAFEKGGIEYLSFKDGKTSLIEWVEATFD